MPIRFQSLRSSSNGNCLMLSSGSTNVLIDCGIKTQRECHAILGEHSGTLSALLVTHAHGDHICYPSLKVLQSYGTPIHCHDEVIPHVNSKHVCEWNSPPRFQSFSTSTFTIGDFEILPIPLPHDPHCPTFGFTLRCGGKKIVVCTDFHDTEAVSDHLVDADFIFIEANHDLELLRRHPNYASRFHLSNEKTAELLCEVRQSARHPPQCVMLGHLSEQRNSDKLVLNTIRQVFEAEELKLDFRLEVAPRYTTSKVIHIA